MSKKKITIKVVDSGAPITFPTKARQKAENILKNEIEILVNSEDFFLLKYIHLLAKVYGIEVEYEYNGEIYPNIYSAPFKFYYVLEDLLDLDIKAMNKDVKV